MSFSNSLAAPLNCLPPHVSPAQSTGCSTIDGRAMSFTPRRPRTDSRQLEGLGSVRQARDYFRGPAVVPPPLGTQRGGDDRLAGAGGGLPLRRDCPGGAGKAKRGPGCPGPQPTHGPPTFLGGNIPSLGTDAFGPP